MKLRVPHTYVLLIGLIALAAASTWIIPAGSYGRVVEQGREVVDPLSYHPIEARPAGFGEIILAFPRGLLEIAEIVFYIFIIGGAFGVLNRTGVIQSGVRALVRRLGGRKALIVPLLTVVFAVGGGTIGIAEETLVFLPALLLLARSLGYDSLLAGGIALVGANAGFAAAFMNPFTVGVAQGIVGLPLFSGMGFRIALWVVMTSVTVVFLARYARRVAAKPETSRMFELDRAREPLAGADRAEPFAGKHLAVLGLVLAALVLLVVGAIRWHWGILELSGLFFGLALAAGPLGGLSLDDTVKSFIGGAADITYAALIVGLARGTLVVLRDAQVLDTITHAMAQALRGWSSTLSALGIYLAQNLLHFIVPSGSGQAAVSMPVLAPLGDLVGVTRQTNVLAYQLGNGLTNVFIPTQGYFMAALGILRIPWTIWVRWLLPLLGIWLAIGAAAVVLASLIRLGPF
ncbi:MAG: C4-dicarboxylate ABC transporter permease [Candidatus Aminicenantes bacterium RBG_16_66_30]|nr:MAG: C4-dicarboxylate ABC transporter permease [Candidatus Aminicenantes bacterium RBG_16_66_30]